MIIVDGIHADADLMSVFERLGRRMNEEGFDEESTSGEEQESTGGQGAGDLCLDRTMA